VHSGEIYEVTNKYTVRLSKLYSAIECVEDIMEETGTGEFRAELTDDTLVVDNSLYEKVARRLLEYGCELKVEGGNPVKPCISLYLETVELYTRGLRPYLRRHVEETLREGVEYYGVVGLDGVALILRGEKGRVRLPRFNHVFAAHTHPSLQAIPSRRDLKTIIEGFTHGVLGHCIEAAYEGICIIRVKPVQLEEYLGSLEKIGRGDSESLTTLGFIRFVKLL